MRALCMVYVSKTGIPYLRTSVPAVPQQEHMQMERRISFNPVDPYIPGVRMTVITGYNRPLLWAEDLIAVASGKDRRYARDVLRHKPKLRLIVKRLDANGGRNTKLISAEDALKLVMELPGTAAARFCVETVRDLQLPEAVSKMILEETLGCKFIP